MEVAARIRDACPDEAPDLSALAMRSKAHWDYDQEFLEACRASLTLSTDDLRTNGVGVLEVAGRVAGFYRISGEPPTGELADLWIEPEFIGQGFGAELVEDARRRAGARGFRALLVESDPNAEEFYAHIGAVRVGERESSVMDGRLLPLMRIELGD